MTPEQLAETLSTIADKAKALRDAGIYGRVQVGDVSFEVGEPAAPVTTTVHDETRGDPMDDPDLYGGHIPHRRRIADGPPSTEDDDE